MQYKIRQKIQKIYQKILLLAVQKSLRQLQHEDYVSNDINCYREFGFKINDYEDIKQQAILVAISVPPSFFEIILAFLLSIPFRSHRNVYSAVVLTHVIDDIFDNSPSNLSRMIEYMLRISSPINTEDFVSQSLSLSKKISPDQKLFLKHRLFTLSRRANLLNRRYFFHGFASMIMAGIVQNYEKWQSIKKDSLLFNKIILAFKQTNFDLLKSNRIKTLWKNHNLSWQVYISSASSLQEIFISFKKDPININKVIAWNGVLGPLVYLNNVKYEVVGKNKKMKEKLNRLATSYLYFIDESWKHIYATMNLTSTEEYLRAFQYHIGYNLMNLNVSQHRFSNFPEALKSILIIYANIETQIERKAEFPLGFMDFADILINTNETAIPIQEKRASY